ncbi:MAG: sugar ABC transporter permease [Clostridia bacterium]|nr:sugar ABC transporter permease [Clostridia bacterium]MBR5986540.1 sugar ABC transporter permease [Clostridia bacterium]MBR6008840.1 sugar ABC transporter permease [Clostridia bacterium]
MTGVRRKRRFRKEDLPLYVMASPTVLWLIVFCYLPIFGLIMAFQNLNITTGILGSAYVGLQNFRFLFSTTDAWIITRNTVCYNVVFIIVNMILAVLMALLLSELRSRFAAKGLQTIYMLPYFLSWAVVAIVVSAFLDRDYGLVNRIMINLGKQETKVDYYTKRELWPPLLVLINAWKGVGYQTVLYLAVISGISTDYYEAAVLDGATKRQQAWYITIPHLRMVISISIIMAMGSIFRGDFGLFYVVTKNTGRLYPVTDVIDTYIYRALTRLSNVGMATASGMYQSVVGLFMVLGVNAIVNRIDPDSAMF